MKTISLHKKLNIVVSEKADGNIDKRFSTPELFRQNRKNLYKYLNIQAYQLIEAAQIHSDRVLKLDSENTKMWRGHNVTGVDGFITNQTDSYLMIRVADCVPIVIYDPDHHAVALIHAGWRGTVKHIHTKSIEMLVKAYGSNPSHLLVWFGPSARDCCFISVEKPDQANDAEWQPYMQHKGSNGWAVNLIGYQMDTFKKVGVLKKNMVVAPECTVEDPSLFSHQRAQTTSEPNGRFAVVVHLKA